MFRCRVLDVEPLPPYAADAAKYGYWLMRQPDGSMLQVELKAG